MGSFLLLLSLLARILIGSEQYIISHGTAEFHFHVRQLTPLSFQIDYCGGSEFLVDLILFFFLQPASTFCLPVFILRKTKEHFYF